MACDDDALYFFLLQGALADTLFDCAACDEAVHCDLAGLPETMGAVHGLRVDGGVPITVVEDDCVGGGEVDTETTGASREEEDEDLWGRLEVGDGVATVFELGRSIETAVLVVAVCEVLLHQVDHTGHLEVQKDTVSAFLELAEEPVELRQLSRVGHETAHTWYTNVGVALLLG